MIETTLTKFLNLSFKFDNRRKTILLLEFDPSQYDSLLYHLGKHNVNVVIFNRRRTALWSIRSIKSLLNSGAKILDLQKIILNNEKKITSTVCADRKSTRLNSSHSQQSRMPSSA